MHGKTHLAVGAATGVALATLHYGTADIKEIGVAAGVAGLAGLVPDWLQINLPGISKNIKGMTGHRGFSHWVLTAGAVAFAVFTLLPARPEYLPPWYALVLAGWLSHVFLDVLAGGAPALWPIAGRVTIAKIKTGGKYDRAFGGAALVIMAMLLIEVYL